MNTLLRRSKTIILTLLIISLLLSVSYALRVDNVGVEGVKKLTLKSQVIVKGGWGKTNSRFGKTEEDLKVGPMSFTVTNNTIYILDQENKRIQIFNSEGQFVKSVPLQKLTYVDIKVYREKIYLLDAYASFSVDVYSKDGEKIESLSLDKKTVPITGFEVNDNEVLVEYNHQYSQAIGKIKRDDIAISNEESIDGRPGPDNESVEGKFSESKAQITEEGKELNLNGGSLQAIIDMINDDTSTYILLGFGEETTDSIKDSYYSLVKTVSGRAYWQIILPDKYATDHFRKVDVDKGIVYQMQTTDEGVSIVKWQQENSS